MILLCAQGAVDRHGIHDIRGPLLAGGVCFLTPATGFFRDGDVRRMISSKERFEAYLQFREEAFKIFATELVSASRYPVDLVLFTDEDGQRFRNNYWFHYMMFRDKSHHFIVNDQINGSGVDSVTADDQSNLIDDYKKDKESRVQKLHYIRRYFAYRKGLLKLDMSQFNNDPEKVLQWLKSSTGWSELLDEELRHGLKSHLDLLKKQDMSKMDQSSKIEFENLALERINSEMASAVEKSLYTDDWPALMGHHCNRTKLRSLARVCSIQAQATGVILVKQALPLREICREQMSTRLEVLKFPSTEQPVKQSLERCLGSLRGMHEKFGRGGARGATWLALLPFAAAATLATNNSKG